MEQLTIEMARRAISDGVPFILSGPAGKIYAANQAFCELVGYSEVELQRIGWIRLSVDDDEQQADVALAEQLVKGQISTYCQWKSFKTRYGNPSHGQLLAIRYPAGESNLEYCLCWFTPIMNGSKMALETVIEYMKSHAAITRENSDAISKMTAAINGNSHKTKFRIMAEAMLDWVQENPKYAIAIVALFFVADPWKMFQNYAAQKGWLPAQPVQLQIEDKKTGSVRPADRDMIYGLEKEYAHSIANVKNEGLHQEAEIREAIAVGFIEVTTKAGNVFSLPSDIGRSMHSDSGCDRCFAGGIRRIDRSNSEAVHGSHELQRRELRDRALKEL
jgi:PAS domain S-box-containing protein